MNRTFIDKEHLFVILSFLFKIKKVWGCLYIVYEKFTMPYTITSYTENQTMFLFLLLSNVFASSYDVLSFDKRVDQVRVNAVTIEACNKSNIERFQNY